MPVEITFDLSRSSPFAYTCNRCLKCCRDKQINLSPYELLRLARNRGIATGELIERFTEEGTRLKFTGPENSCVFLGPAGCTVHPDRPLVCRLYPLGRFATPDGGEAFACMEGHPESLGEFTPPDRLRESDTVGAFVESQGIEPYVAAAQRYYHLLQELRDRQKVEESSRPESGESGLLGDVNLLDADAVNARYAAAHGLEAPADPESAMEMHLGALRAWASSL